MLQHLLFGKLTLQAIPYENPIIMGAVLFMGSIFLCILAAITYYKKWTYLWDEWITSVDHKRIGVMYIGLALIMLFRGFIDAFMMRLQLALSVDHNMGYLPPEHYNQIFTAHGVIMIFFMAMPLMFGLINIVLPLMIGARDVAYPYLNSLSLWLAVAGATLMNISLFVGDFAATGWLAYPPLSELALSPSVGVDYYIWALQISGVGTLLSAINFVATIFKMRCPGMTLMKMPIFVWTALCSMILIILAFPVLTATLALLFLDRYFGMHFFTAGFGGNAMLYINLIWVWGHPEVYILILPAFGIYSEIVATFSKKYLFGYVTMVWATASITLLSFLVWLHHFFTMGAGANVNAVFGIATMVIAIPTGVKVFNWLFTMYRGRVRFTTPMLWTIAFITTFVFGGMTGVMMAVPAIDFQVHNSLFLVAHFHNTIIGGVVFGYLAGVTYWFPKAFGFKLNETLGKCAFWCWFIGFYVAFTPVYIVGLMGMTRRLSHYDSATGWHPFLIVAAIGTCLIGIGFVFQVIQLIEGFLNRQRYRDVTGDPWNGRTLEWSIPSPPPFYNFAHLPLVSERDAFWHEKRNGHKMAKPYEPIHMPRNTSTGVIIGILSGLFGFAMIWHMELIAIASLVAIAASIIRRSTDPNIDYTLSAEEVAKIEASLVKG